MEKKNVIKIVIAIAVILLIVIATFAYGDAQRKAQQKGQAKSTQTSQNTQGSTSNQTVTPQGGGNQPSGVQNPAAPAPPTNGQTPQTGPEVFYALPIGIITVLYFYNRKLIKAHSR
ncbi:MAG: hypothetical protein Q8P54_02300 [bacterium]|nr:hypothetical protein [bacterium]